MGQLIPTEKFHEMYMIQKLDKKTILAQCPMSEVTWRKYVDKANALNMNEITTTSLEKEILEMYNSTGDAKEKKDLLKIITDIWKVKHKVPSESKEPQIDYSQLLSGGLTAKN